MYVITFSTSHPQPAVSSSIKEAPQGPSLGSSQNKALMPMRRQRPQPVVWSWDWPFSGKRGPRVSPSCLRASEPLGARVSLLALLSQRITPDQRAS